MFPKGIQGYMQKIRQICAVKQQKGIYEINALLLIGQLRFQPFVCEFLSQVLIIAHISVVNSHAKYFWHFKTPS